MKSTILNVRIPENLKINLERIAESENISISDLVRNVLQQFVEEQNNEIQKIIDSMNTVKYPSEDFTYLISWMYEKQFNCYHTGSEKELKQLTHTITSIIKDDLYPVFLKNELEKVHTDLIRFCNENNTSKKYFTFGIENQNNSFDYNVLREFIRNKGFSFNSI